MCALFFAWFYFILFYFTFDLLLFLFVIRFNVCKKKQKRRHANIVHNTYFATIISQHYPFAKNMVNFIQTLTTNILSIIAIFHFQVQCQHNLTTQQKAKQTLFCRCLLAHSILQLQMCSFFCHLQSHSWKP